MVDIFDGSNLFKRRSIMRIKNATSSDWTLQDYENIHGHFDSYSAPKQLSSGHSAIITVSNSGLGYVSGPEGTATYTATINGKPVQIQFYWMHPVGPGASIYRVTSTPQGVVRYTLSPPTPTGWDQDISIDVFNN